ncbi:DUF6894 family protein [Methylobacterium thuringiense]|uniref:DUF6894 family protein n=1 Tax=Methylobacterium thuringiense TaxID=1003091 RepID=UPI001EDFCD1F|nr:hypothetical protein [Methylobacterium thuringiense]
MTGKADAPREVGSTALEDGMQPRCHVIVAGRGCANGAGLALTYAGQRREPRHGFVGHHGTLGSVRDRQPMPKYFLHVHDSTGRVADLDGSELPNLDAAWAKAMESARCILADRVRNGRPIGRHYIEIADEGDQALAYVPMRAALDLS